MTTKRDFKFTLASSQNARRSTTNDVLTDMPTPSKEELMVSTRTPERKSRSITRSEHATRTRRISDNFNIAKCRQATTLRCSRSFSRKRENEQALGKLQCHFNWKLDPTSQDHEISCSVDDLELKLIEEIRGSPDVACMAYLLLGYAFAVGDKDDVANYGCALSALDFAAERAANKAERYVEKACRVILLFKSGQSTANTSETIKELQNLENDFTNKDKSDLNVILGFALSKFTYSGYERSLNAYRDARNLCRENAEAHFGIGVMLGRIRRFEQPNICRANKEELDAFRTVIALADANPMYHAFYARALTDGLRELSNVSYRQYQNISKEISTIFGQFVDIERRCHPRFKKVYRDANFHLNNVHRIAISCKHNKAKIVEDVPNLLARIRNILREYPDYLRQIEVVQRCVKQLGLTLNTMQNLGKEIVKCLNKALAKSNKHSSRVFRLCARGYKFLALSLEDRKIREFYNDRQKFCIDTALDLSPADSSVLHLAGLFYWKTRPFHDMELARTYLSKAPRCALFKSNIWADLDFIQFQKETVETFDKIQALEALLIRYKSRQDWQAIIYEKIALEKMKVLRDEVGAYEYFCMALKCSPLCDKIKSTKQLLPELLEKQVNTVQLALNNDNFEEHENIETLHEVADVYNTFIPTRAKEALNCYNIILGIDENNTDAKIGIAQCLFKLERYQECITACEGCDMEEQEEILTSAFFRMASDLSKNVGTNITDSTKMQVLDFALQSALHGSSKQPQGAQMYLRLLGQACKPSVKFYEDLATIQIRHKDNTDVCGLIKEYFGGLKLRFPLHHALRETRYDLTNAKLEDEDASTYLGNTLLRAKALLDISANKLGQRYFDKKKSYNYLYFKPEVKEKLQPNPYDIKTCPVMLGYKKKGINLEHQALGFQGNLELYHFLKARSSVYHDRNDFVTKFIEKRIDEEHVHGCIEDTPEHYDLAQKAAEYADEVACKLLEYVNKKKGE